MKIIFTLCAFLIGFSHAFAENKARVEQIILTPTFKKSPNSAELSARIKLTSSTPQIRKPILYVCCLLLGDDKVPAHYTFISVDLKKFENQYGAYGSLMALSGKPTSSAPRIVSNQQELIKNASLGAMRVPSETIRLIEPKGRVFIYGKQVVGIYGELWSDGTLIGSYEKTDQATLSKLQVQKDWYEYAKYPDTVYYTTISRYEHPGERPSNIKSLLK